MLVAAFAQAFHESGRGGVIAVLALHRFDNHGGGVGRVALGGEDMVQLVEAVGDTLIHVLLIAISVRERGNADPGHQRLPAGTYLAGGRGQRGGGQGAAVETTAKGDEIGAAGGLARQANGCFHGLAAGVGKRYRIKPFGQVFVEPVGEGQHVGVSDGGVLGVNQLGDLRLRGGDHFGVTVAGGGHADAGGEVQPAVAFFIIEPATFAALCANPAGLNQ